MLNTREALSAALQGPVGQPCTAVSNPIGSTIVIDIGDMRHVDDASAEHLQGWRRITIGSPWRLQTVHRVICDWNSDSSPDGELIASLAALVGVRLDAISISGPAWDMVTHWSNGYQLVVFSDSDDLREYSWFILGADGLEITVSPKAAGDDTWRIKQPGGRS
ncbi:MAG: hypothetical protein IPF77_16060 [Gemmatimonadetes bacterium]|nr:hypothetical protein [Gemmatimonadota bacterium]